MGFKNQKDWAVIFPSPSKLSLSLSLSSSSYRENLIKEINCFDKLLGLHLTADLKWDTYITLLAKGTAKLIEQLYFSRMYLIPNVLFNLYKNQIYSKIVNSSHIWAGSS